MIPITQRKQGYMQGGFKDIIKIAAPVIVASMAQTSISVADTAMMGRLGEVQVGAIGIVSVYYLMLFMIGFSYTKSTQILVARRIGEKNLEGVGRVFDNSLATIVTMGIILFLMLRFGTSPALDVLISNPQVREAGKEFLELRSFGIIFSLIGSVFLAFYMGLGRVTIIAFGVITMSALNIFLNYVFIYGHYGVPAMGIRGSALASNTAEIYACVLFLIYTIYLKAHKTYFLFRPKTLSREIMISTGKLAAPIVAQTLIGLLAWVFFFTFVEKMGAHDTAISSIVKSVYMFFGLFAWGFTTSANTIISNLMGQQKFDQVVRAVKNIVFLSFVFQVVTAIPLAIFPRAFIGIFTQEQQLITDSIPVVYICILALLIYSVSTTMFYGIVSTGSVNSSLRIEIITVLIYLVFVVFIFSVPWKTITIVWLSEAVYWLVLAIFTLSYLMTGRWKHTKI